MPSQNYTVSICEGQRIRINVCEGQVNVSHEERGISGYWKVIDGGHFGPISRDTAEQLAQTMLHGLRSGF